MKKLGHKIKKLRLADTNLLNVVLEFADGTIGRVSLEHIFEKPKGLAAEILRGGAFNKCFVEGGALAWPNGFELCPDALRQWLEQQQRTKKKAA